MSAYATLYILVGMPGAGKTTWARRFVREFGGTHADTNQIRRDLTGRINEQEKNKAVFAVWYRTIERALARGRDAIADSTGLDYRTRLQLYQMARAHRADIQVILFTNPRLARRRNERREDPDAVVPEDVMNRMEKKLATTLDSIGDESCATNILRIER